MTRKPLEYIGPCRALASATLIGAVVLGCHGSNEPADRFEPRPSTVPRPSVSREQGRAITSEPLVVDRGEPGPLFENLSAEQTGIHFVNVLDPNHPMRYLYHSGTSCGGVAIGDVDGDGRPDIYLCSGVGTNKLYRQAGDLSFEDVTARARVDGGGAWSTGATMVDIDGDRDLDIYVCNYDAPNLLYVNRGDGTFVEQAADYALDLVDASLMSAFCDYDLDGDLDAYLLTNRYYDPQGMPTKASDYTVRNNGKLQVRPDKKRYWRILVAPDGRNWSLAPVAPADRLLRNDGNGTFSDVTKVAGIGGYGDGLSATWWDYDQDGWPDLYVGNDFDAPDQLYRNRGDGTFIDVIRQTVPHTSWFSMGADVGDINNDGKLDFLTADMSATSHFMQKTTMGAMSRKTAFLETAKPRQYMRNALYLNTGKPRFMEVAYLAGLADTNWTWSVKLADLDNDGRVDVFFTNGTARNTTDSDVKVDMKRMAGRNMWEAWRDKPPRREHNLAFRNVGDLRFEDVSKAWGLDHWGMSYGSAHGDLDRDGDLDLVVVNLDEPVSLYRNRSASGHRAIIRLRGTVNTFGIGATVTLNCGALRQIRQLKACSGFMSSDEPLVHFGLGDHRKIDKLVVHWPSRHVQTFEDLPADRLYTITEPEDASSRPRPSPPPSTTSFQETRALSGVVHRENKFDDFQRQPLLPNRLSQLGPGMAWGDVDGDGDEDVYVGGAAGQPGTLLRNHGDQGLLPDKNSSRRFRDDQLCEDMASLFLDADADGDLDLYVVSGGVECAPESGLLQDRLYWNDGTGGFAKASADVLPDARDSGSTAVAGDFDRDGDLDLFVGGRVIPGEYPLAPRSRLLQNQKGRFVDVTENLAPQLGRSGLVTSALWSDADNDGLLDLWVTHEWGPVKFFHNEQGRLVDRTQTAGLSDRLGWWNSIAGRDLDSDGDMDYVITNVGLNTKYHASPQKPALLFYGDFGGTGKLSLVEAEFEDSRIFPVRGKSCSTGAMPFLSSTFKSYKDFALAELHEIYRDDRLKEARRFEVNTLQSGVLLGDGDGRFVFHPLPRLAQASPGFGIALTEVDGDGNADLFLVQNFFGPQPETGRMDGGLGLLLLGHGDGTFAPVLPDRSGIVIPGDARCLATTDLNRDGWPDFVVGINNGPIQTFENRRSRANRTAVVRLRGKAGNPSAVGARVTVHLDDGSRQTAEVCAGGGYLSQSTSDLVWGLGPSAMAERVDVRWPDGQITSSTPELTAGVILIDWP